MKNNYLEHQDDETKNNKFFKFPNQQINNTIYLFFINAKKQMKTMEGTLLIHEDSIPDQ